MAVLLAVGLLALNFLWITDVRHPADRILGGPETDSAGSPFGSSTPTDTMGALFAGVGMNSRPGSFALFAGAVRDSGVRQGPAGGPERGLVVYAVEKGDTLSSIAGDFGISLATLIQANPEVKSRALKVGAPLVILPTSGALHVAEDGDTLETIAALYGADLEKIREFNPGVGASALADGTRVMIPGARPTDGGRTVAVASVIASFASASLDKNYFITPAKGFNWGILHGKNGVDIANRCGTPVVAAADGLVIPVGSCADEEGWNGGYGTCVALQHPGSVSTIYAHLAQTSVALGDYLKRGEALGTMGSTGKSTGCHLHFEVRGAPNPFAKY